MATATLEDRVTSLEWRMSHLQGQVLISTVRQIHLDLLDFKSGVEARFNALESRFDCLECKFDRLEGKIDSLGARVDGLANDVDRICAQFDRLNAKVDAMPRVIAEIVSGLLKK